MPCNRYSLLSLSDNYLRKKSMMMMYRMPQSEALAELSDWLDVADLNAHTRSGLNLIPTRSQYPLNPLTNASSTKHDD